MSTDIDWHHELDSSFGTGHDRAPAHYVATGRRAVRRRRQAAALLTAAALVLCGGAVWSVAPGGPSRSDAPVASDGPSPDLAEQRAEQREERRRRREDRLEELRAAAGARPDFIGNPATLTDDGLVLAPGAGPVLERAPEPMGYAAGSGSTSIGLRVMFEGQEKYSLLVHDGEGGTSLHTEPATGDFAGWLASAVSTQRSLDQYDATSEASVTSTPDAWLALDRDGAVTSSSPFVAVLESREVDLGSSFGLDTDRTGVARLRVAGSPAFVAWRVVLGELEVIQGRGRFESLDAFVRWARQQYASGEGLR